MITIYRINTTAYDEEDFYIITDLSEQDITEVIHPIVMTERDGYEDYDNDSLYTALKKRYPSNIIQMHNEIETLYF